MAEAEAEDAEDGEMRAEITAKMPYIDPSAVAVAVEDFVAMIFAAAFEAAFEAASAAPFKAGESSAMKWRATGDGGSG